MEVPSTMGVCPAGDENSEFCNLTMTSGLGGEAVASVTVSANDTLKHLYKTTAESLAVDMTTVQLLLGGLPLESSDATLSSVGLYDGMEVGVVIVRDLEEFVDNRLMQVNRDEPYLCMVGLDWEHTDPRKLRVHPTQYLDELYSCQRRSVDFALQVAESRENRMQDVVCADVFGMGEVYWNHFSNWCQVYNRIRHFDPSQPLPDDPFGNFRQGIIDRVQHDVVECAPRRSVQFAVQAAESRETRMQELVVAGDGICNGSTPRDPSQPPPDEWWCPAGCCCRRSPYIQAWGRLIHEVSPDCKCDER